jgi:hypothetical protein
VNGAAGDVASNLQRSVPKSEQLLTGTCKTLAKPMVVTAEGGAGVCVTQFVCGRENDRLENDVVTVACRAKGKFSCPPLSDCLKDTAATVETADVKWQTHTPSNYSHTVTHLDGYPELETKAIYRNEISLYASGLDSRGRQVGKPGIQPEQREPASAKPEGEKAEGAKRRR